MDMLYIAKLVRFSKIQFAETIRFWAIYTVVNVTDSHHAAGTLSPNRQQNKCKKIKKHNVLHRNISRTMHHNKI